jgi:hypothetical protein
MADETKIPIPPAPPEISQTLVPPSQNLLAAQLPAQAPKKNPSPKRVFGFLLGLVVLVVVVLSAWLAVRTHIKVKNIPAPQAAKTAVAPKPKQVIDSPAGYAPSVIIEEYTQAPAEFSPSLWISPTDVPQHADIVKNLAGGDQVTVVYQTSQTVAQVLEAEKQLLAKASWQVRQSQTFPNVGFVSAAKAPQQLTVTAANSSGGTRVTFQLNLNSGGG